MSEEAQPKQLTLSGGEVAHPLDLPRFSKAQREILRKLGVFGQLRSFEAGKIVHDARGHCAGLAFPTSERAVSCCIYGSTDGSSAMKRLEKRGYVVAVGRGLWKLAERESF